MAQGPVREYMKGGDVDAKGGCSVDHEALAQAHVNVITGACMAIGIKASPQPFKRAYVHMQLQPHVIS